MCTDLQMAEAQLWTSSCFLMSNNSCHLFANQGQNSFVHISSMAVFIKDAATAFDNREQTHFVDAVSAAAA